MKKIILLAMFILLLGAAGNAQGNTDYSWGKFKVGFKVGANYSNVYNAHGELFTSRPNSGLALGIFIEAPLSETVGLQPEILYSRKGFEAEGILMNAVYLLSRNTSYIDFPIFLSIKVTDALTLLIGPQFSYLLKQQNNFNDAEMTDLQIQAFNNEKIKTSNLGFSTGIDFRLKHILLAPRASIDVSNNNGNHTETPTYKNFYFQLTAGYFIATN
ncbi:PorT family protein [Fulvivirga maritima]|uniref:porin family protein n=1 Tax=Fulvivirga maritima TaxID=2904247 RepID=UPI001F3EEAAE|nr:porin family protein [Fulvivirga maritima]UII27600.1 PorT family protein [Fulvivirga maritima]